jgi:hypothetical protein
MTQDDYARKLDELDRLLNDPDVTLDPARVWALLADLSERKTGIAAGLSTGIEAELAMASAGGTGD